MKKRPLAFVIEDQASLNTLYEDALRLVGYDVIAVRDGLEALNQLEINEPPTFVILDINLPGLSGRDIHQHIRKHSRYDNTPVMILTANSVMANAIRPEITKNDHLFIKPMSMKALQEFAKMMRPGKEGVPDYMAKTQKIPEIPFLDVEDEEETRKTIPEVLTPDNALKVDTQSQTEAKLESKEHMAIITPENEVVDTQTGEKLVTKTDEIASITENKETIQSQDNSSTESTETSEAKETESIEKAPTTDAEAQEDSKSENG